MFSGFLTSPCDHSRIFSGDASEIRIALKDSGSLGFSKKLKMSRIGAFPFPVLPDKPKKLRGSEEERTHRQIGKIGRSFLPDLPDLFVSHSSAACSTRPSRGG